MASMSPPSRVGPPPAVRELREPSDLVADLPEVRLFVQSCPEAQQLCVEAHAGRRAAALRLFFEGCEEALQQVAHERRCPPAPVYWKDREGNVSSNNVACLPEDRMDFVAGVREKCRTLLVFGGARRLVLTPADSGFFAAFLGVLDNLMMADPAAEATVDWRLRGNEKHFTYWPARSGACVWRELFEPVHRAARPAVEEEEDDEAPAMGVHLRWNYLFSGRFRWRLRGSRFARGQRAAYHAVYKRWVRLRHPQLLRDLATLGAALRAGDSIGVHKRVDTPGTAAYQGTKRVPTAADFVAAVRRVAARMARPPTHIFLATDCALAEATFRAAFGERLVVRQGVQRTPGGVNADHTLNEAHIRSPHNPEPGFNNALDVLTDAILLSHCGRVLHMDSNVSSAVGIINPELEMLHVADVLTAPEYS